MLKDKLKNPDSVDVVALPKDKQQATIIHGLGWVTAAKSKNLAAAQALAASFGSQEAQQTEATNGTAIPAYNGTQAKWLELNPNWNLKVYTDSATQYAIPYPASKNTSAWADKQAEILNPAFAGETTVADAAAKMATAMNNALAEEG